MIMSYQFLNYDYSLNDIENSISDSSLNNINSLNQLVNRSGNKLIITFWMNCK